MHKTILILPGDGIAPEVTADLTCPKSSMAAGRRNWVIQLPALVSYWFSGWHRGYSFYTEVVQG